jgi:hypothetical protein
LERNASQRESQKVSRDGHVEVGSVDELIARLHGNPYHVGCSAIDAVKWFERVKIAEEERRVGHISGEANLPAIAYVLNYKDAIMQEGRSRAYTPVAD